jgi:hypothetical protein|tara:strand:+ start:470 stop:655 length:186 start_codon:yes stop_codon:yes gene_type:complete
MKCTKQGCPNTAEFVIDGQSICEDHKDNKGSQEKEQPAAEPQPEEQKEQSMAERMIGKFRL